MRLTVDDCIERGIVGRVDVFVDGRKVAACFEADDVEGYALCRPTNAEGRVVADFDEDGNLKVVRHDGRVEIRIRDEVAK